MSLPARIGTCRSAIALVRVKRGSTWITLRAAALSLDHPLKPDRMALRHVRSLDQDAVGVRQVLLEGGRPSSSERRPQTGDGGGVSYTGLVLDLHRPERREQLLDEVVLLVVERRAAEAREAARAAQACGPRRRTPPTSRRASAITRSAIMSIARSSVQVLPLGPVRAPVLDRRHAASGLLPASASRRPSGTAARARSGESGSPSIWITCSSWT